jgi:hypothetical protein
MSYSNNFQVYEKSDNSNLINIEQLVDEIGISDFMKPGVISWWNKNKRDIKMYFLPFLRRKPLAALFLSEDTIVINEKLKMSPHVRLFLILHETHHCEQYKDGRFTKGYYETVLRNDRESFTKAYVELQKEANDFAINSMIEIGFDIEMEVAEMRLRASERSADTIYNLMKEEISTLDPNNITEFQIKQIL